MMQSMYDFQQETGKIYVKTDIAGRILAVGAAWHLPDLAGWLEIDSSDSGSRESRDAYRHAQNNYFPEGLKNCDGTHKYKYAPENLPAYRKVTPEEEAAELAEIVASQSASMPSPEEEKLDMLEQLVMMQAQIAQLQINTGGI